MWDLRGKKAHGSKLREREGEESGIWYLANTSILLPTSKYSCPASRACGCCQPFRAQTVWPRPAPAFPVNLSAPPARANTLSFDWVHILSTFLWATAQVLYVAAQTK